MQVSVSRDKETDRNKDLWKASKLYRERGALAKAHARPRKMGREIATTS